MMLRNLVFTLLLLLVPSAGLALGSAPGPTLNEGQGSPLHEVLPHFLSVRPFGVMELWQWLGLVLLVGAAGVASRLLEKVGLRLGAGAVRLANSGWDDQVFSAGKGRLRFTLLAMMGSLGSRMLLPPPAQQGVDLAARSLASEGDGWSQVEGRTSQVGPPRYHGGARRGMTWRLARA